MKLGVMSKGVLESTDSSSSSSTRYFAPLPGVQETASLLQLKRPPQRGRDVFEADGQHQSLNVRISRRQTGPTSVAVNIFEACIVPTPDQDVFRSTTLSDLFGRVLIGHRANAHSTIPKK
jgi:hypothetical protein